VRSHHITVSGDLLIAAPRGRMAQGEAVELCEQVAARVNEGVGRVLLDFSAVDYMTSSALGAIISLLQKVRSGGGRMAVAAPTERVHLLMEVAGLNQLLALCVSREDAEHRLSAEAAEG
jgi:anti-anti-sigma factor